jgi:hypothetical protein
MTAEKRQKEHQSMSSRLLPKLNYSNVIATIALFVALGGAAVAAGLPKHSVGANQLKRGAVNAAAIKKGAVTSGKLAPKSVVAGKLGPNSVSPGNIGNGAITSAKIAAGSVLASAIKNGVITNPKLGNGVVNTSKLAANAVTSTILANGSVTTAKLGPEIAPLLGTLRSGQTLRGMIDIGVGTASATAVHSAESFQFPLTNAPTAPEANVIKVGGSATPACAGVTGGNQQTPQAAAGQLCVYLTNASKTLEGVSFDGGSVSRLGFGLTAKFSSEAGTENFVQGFWAVTAP